MTGIKEDKLGVPTVKHHEFRNKRKLEGIVFAMNYLFPVLPYTPENTNTKKLFQHIGTRVKNIISGNQEQKEIGESPEIIQAKNIHNRLANGILDGAISTFDFEDFSLST